MLHDTLTAPDYEDIKNNATLETTFGAWANGAIDIALYPPYLHGEKNLSKNGL
jgi:hypothetical protein